MEIRIRLEELEQLLPDDSDQAQERFEKIVFELWDLGFGVERVDGKYVTKAREIENDAI